MYESPGDAFFEVIQQWTIRLQFLFLLGPISTLAYSIVIRKTVINRNVMRNMVMING